MSKRMRRAAACSLFISLLSHFQNSIFVIPSTVFGIQKISGQAHAMRSCLFFTYILSITFSKFDIP
jgi:hypothetical protein